MSDRSTALVVIPDNGSTIHQFPSGAAYVVEALGRTHDVDVYDKAQHHYAPEHLTALLDSRDDIRVVSVGTCGGWWQYRELVRISESVNASRNRTRIRYVLGGHLPSPDPVWALQRFGADSVVIGEAEDAILRAADWERISCGPREWEIDSLPWPAYDRFDVDYYRLCHYPRKRPEQFAMPVVSARGCPYSCSFCYRMDDSYRPRSPAAVMEEIEYLHKEWGITYINFSDELLMASPARASEMCEAIRGLSFRLDWMCNGRLNVAARHPEVIGDMAASGCVFVNYGVEAISNDVLERMNKRLAVDEIIIGTEATLRAGISPGLNIMWGNPGDTAETLDLAVSFLLKYADTSQVRTIRPVTPYPGSALYKQCVRDGLIKDAADFYERLHVNSDLPTVDMCGIDLRTQRALLLSANMELVRANAAAVADIRCQQLADLYVGRNNEFRGFRTT